MLKTPITHFFFGSCITGLYIYISIYRGWNQLCSHPILTPGHLWTDFDFAAVASLAAPGRLPPRGVSAGKIWGFSKNGDTQQPWAFLLKMIILEVFLGYHHLRKHPYINQLSQNDGMFHVLLSLSLCVLLVGKLNCCLLQVVQQVLLASL